MVAAKLARAQQGPTGQPIVTLCDFLGGSTPPIPQDILGTGGGKFLDIRLLVLFVTAFVDMVGLTMIVPLLPYYATNFGANASMVGAPKVGGRRGIRRGRMMLDWAEGVAHPLRRSLRKWPCIGVATLAFLASAVTLPAQALPDLDRLATADDSAEAIRLLERVVRRDFRNAEAHYRLGVLHFARFTPGENVSADRRQAEEHLRLATRFASDSAQYWLALASVYYSQSEVSVRLQVSNTVSRAVTAARATRSPYLARALSRRGRLDWQRYEQQAHRYRLSGTIYDIDQDAFLNDWEYVEDLFGRRLRAEHGGIVEWAVAERSLQEAHRLDSVDLDIAGLLVVAMGAGRTWDSAATVARRLVNNAPQNGQAWALYGLTLARTDAWEEAEAAYDSAFRLLDPAARAPYEHIPLVLSQDAGAAHAGRGVPERARERVIHWRAWDPLWIAAGNKPRTEFYARVTYADYRWADPAHGYRGWETERGAVYVRYGPPDLEATLGASGVDRDPVVVVRGWHQDPDRMRLNPGERLDRERNRILWVYVPSRLRFIFGITQGYARASFAGASRHALYVAQKKDPARYDNVPLPAIDSLPLVAAQFRGDRPGLVTVAIFGEAPALAWTADSIAILGAADTARSVRAGRVLRTYRGPLGVLGTVDLPPGPATVRVEALGRDGALRGALPVRLRAPVDSGVDISDLLLGRMVATPSNAARWTDLEIHPVRDTVPGDALALVWESYALAPDSTGTVTYDVELRVEATALARRGIFARVIGGIGDVLGLTLEGDEVAIITYRRTVPARSDGAYVDAVTMDVSTLPPGRYVFAVRVTDATARTAVATRTVSIPD